MIIYTPTQNLKARELRLYSHWKRVDGVWIVTIKGVEMTEAELDALYPLPDKVRIPDRKYKGETIGQILK